MNPALPRAIVIEDTGPPSAQAEAEDPGFGFMFLDLASVLLSQRVLVLAIILLSIVGGVAFALTRTPTYSATALVGLGPRQGTEIHQAGQVAPAAPDTAVLESEIEALKSNDMMSRLIDQVTPVATARSLGYKKPETFAAAAPDTALRRDLVMALQSSLGVSRQQSSNVISVTFITPSPTASALLANTLTDVYLKSKMDERLDAAGNAGGWLQERLVEMRAEVERREAAVAAYREQTQLLSVSTGGTINEQQFFELQDRVVAARADYAEKQARMSQLMRVTASGGTAESVLE
ncbi:MAG TPA: Wzz/FepE/Etk N-terminal domain-containing protein, partial [Verrucomicrobiae bacterium]|nr:Wzz/FepE/Etk N-terminal domain-containing protein [Verrucomicrobiae bacterium]